MPATNVYPLRDGISFEDAAAFPLVFETAYRMLVTKAALHEEEWVLVWGIGSGVSTAGLGAGIAHQCHGAIGFTYEHSLHFVTRRLWSWRAEFGGESHWSLELGREVAARGAEALWPHLTSR